jgi:hypothetical protein
MQADALLQQLFLLRIIAFGFVNLLKGCQKLMIGFLFGQPEEMLVELCELLEDGALPGVRGVVLSNQDGRIDDVHDELSVVPVFPAFFTLEVVADLDPTREDEVVFLILCSVDLCYDLSHARSAA